MRIGTFRANGTTQAQTCLNLKHQQTLRYTFTRYEDIQLNTEFKRYLYIYRSGSTQCACWRLKLAWVNMINELLRPIVLMRNEHYSPYQCDGMVVAYLQSYCDKVNLGNTTYSVPDLYDACKLDAIWCPLGNGLQWRTYPARTRYTKRLASVNNLIITKCHSLYTTPSTLIKL